MCLGTFLSPFDPCFFQQHRFAFKLYFYLNSKIIKSDFAAAEVTCEAIIHFYVVKKMRNDLT